MEATRERTGRAPRPVDVHAKVRTGSVLRAWAAALTAGFVAAVVHLLALVVSKTYPFGAVPWAVNDGYDQMVPHKAYVRRLLLGDAPEESLLFNWYSALGVPYLGDFSTYSASPFNLLLVFVPETNLMVGVLLVSLVQVATAAALMVVLLRSLHHEAGWLWAAAFGAAYGVSGWVSGDAMVVLSWLDGFVAAPALMLAAVAIMRRQAIVWPVLIVGAAWTANYYTAMMATLGTGVVAMFLLALDWRGLRASMVALTRVVLHFAWGIALSLWLLVPTLHMVTQAAPVPESGMYQVDWDTHLARLYPGAWTLGSGGIFVTTIVLVVIVAGLMHRGLGVRHRIAGGALALFAVGSMQVPLLQVIWHGFDVPNGSAYREAFVVSAMLIVAAWTLLVKGLPGKGAWAAGGAIVLLGAGVLTITGALTPVQCAATAGSIAVALLVRLWQPRLLPAVAVLLVAAEGLMTATTTYAGIRELPAMTANSSLSSSTMADRLDMARQASPGARVVFEGGPTNDPILTGYHGPTYYSSVVPEQTAAAYRGLGLYEQRRRVGVRIGDTVARTLLGFRGLAEEPGPWAVTLPEAADGGAGVFARRNELALVELYEVPELEITSTAEKTAVRGRCEAGEELFVNARGGKDTAFVSSTGKTDPWPSNGVRGVEGLGESGEFQFALTGATVQIETGDVGCLIPDRLEQHRALVAEQGATVDIRSAGLDVAWDTPQTGEVVVLTTAVQGWSCSVDGAPVETGERAGMLSVAVANATRLQCDFQVKGLWLGSAVSGLALLALLIVGFAARRADKQPLREEVAEGDGEQAGDERGPLVGDA